MEGLPEDMWMLVLAKVDVRSLRRLSYTCTRVRALVTSEHTWRMLATIHIQEHCSARNFAKNNKLKDSSWHSIYLTLVNGQKKMHSHKSNNYPSRLFVYMARDSRNAVILRKECSGKPLQWQMLKWNTHTDQVVRGQWLKGKIQPKCCDLSPNGELFIYYCWRRKRNVETQEWTAISRPPYFTAVGFWDLRGIHYYGGGKFLSDTEVCRYVIDAYIADTTICTKPPKIEVHTFTINLNATDRKKKPNNVIIPENVLPSLAQSSDYRGYDQRGRVVYTQGLRLYVAKETEDGKIVNSRLLLDLTNETFTKVAPPTWATTWNETS